MSSCSFSKYSWVHTMCQELFSRQEPSPSCSCSQWCVHLKECGLQIGSPYPPLSCYSSSIPQNAWPWLKKAVQPLPGIEPFLCRLLCSITKPGLWECLRSVESSGSSGLAGFLPTRPHIAKGSAQPKHCFDLLDAFGSPYGEMPGVCLVASEQVCNQRPGKSMTETKKDIWGQKRWGKMMWALFFQV